MIEREGDHVVLRIRGDLSARLMTDVLRESLEEHYVDDGVHLIRLNISGVRFVDSYGVATLVGLMRASRPGKAVRGRGGPRARSATSSR